MQIINDHQKFNELKCCYSIEIKQTPKQLIHPSRVSSNGYKELEIYKNYKNTITYCVGVEENRSGFASGFCSGGPN